MAVPPLITQRDLELIIGPTRLAQLCDMVGNGRAAPEVVADIIQVGSDETAGLMTAGFSVIALQAVIADDSSVRRNIGWLCLGAAAEGRTEFQDDKGGFLYDKPRDRARKAIKDIGNKLERSAAEETTGNTNELAKPVTSRRAGRRRRFNFCDTDDRRGSGGF